MIANVVSNQALEPLSTPMNLISILSCSIMILISYLIRRKNRGFSFYFDTPSTRYGLTGTLKSASTILIIFLLLIGCILSYSNTIYQMDILGFVLTVILLAVNVTILMIFSYKKEQNEG
ncbi:hypothetical protein [Marinicrinis sediminis]|uniref:Uncharacterized protein n=1 Tax=Marinicrinis sediminis TaxID=1652465 RepID=A0ABW5REH5_9BACL